MGEPVAPPSVIQVRIALMGLILSVFIENVIPLIGAMLAVIVIGIYSNGAFNDNEEFSGETV